MKNNSKFSIMTLLVAVLISTVVEAQNTPQVPINTLRGPRQWSPQAKGAAIGGATGAAAGAIINKRNRVVGGVVGGVVGAGAGYAIGKHVDNKRKAAAALAARRAEEERIAEARRQDQIAYGEANRTMRSANRPAPTVNTSAPVRPVAVATEGTAANAGVVAPSVSNVPAPALVAQQETAPATQPSVQPVSSVTSAPVPTSSANWLTQIALVVAAVSLACCGWLFLKVKRMS